MFLAIDAVHSGVQKLDESEEGLQVLTVSIQEVLQNLNKGMLRQSMHVSAVLLGLAAAGRLKLEDMHTAQSTSLPPTSQEF